MTLRIDRHRLQSLPPISLINTCSNALQAYFKNSWELYDCLFLSIQEGCAYYQQPDPLRNPLIFYLGHTAVFYINKLKLAGLIKKGINAEYEKIFSVGVDPENPEDLFNNNVRWPEEDKVWKYRVQAYELISQLINNIKLPNSINQEDPLWSLFMGIEHERIHFETSSVLIRQCSTKFLKQPHSWVIAPFEGEVVPSKNILYVPKGEVVLGKKDPSVFGWDNEYGYFKKDIPGFYASQNLITNEEFLEFVQANGYLTKAYWSKNGWNWNRKSHTKYPKFWIKEEENFLYRGVFHVLNLPLQWPVEVNFYEAEAFCHWKGNGWRLMKEEEYRRAGDYFQLTIKGLDFRESHNINLKYCSPSPVGLLSTHETEVFNDIYGNVWEWLDTEFYPLPGFTPHPYYSDFSLPYFDNDHTMMLGGSWASTGTSASPDYRLWFRKNFFQHAGFRIARSELRE